MISMHTTACILHMLNKMIKNLVCIVEQNMNHLLTSVTQAFNLRDFGCFCKENSLDIRGAPPQLKTV